MKYSHVVVTAVFCAAALIACLFLPAAGLVFFFPAWFYIGREVAQAEYRYISSHGGKRANCPWYCGLFSEAWNMKSFLDWALPLAVSAVFFACISVACLFGVIPL